MNIQIIAINVTIAFITICTIVAVILVLRLVFLPQNNNEKDIEEKTLTEGEKFIILLEQGYFTRYSEIFEDTKGEERKCRKLKKSIDPEVSSKIMQLNIQNSDELISGDWR